MFDSMSYSLLYIGLSQQSSSVAELASGQPRVFPAYFVLVSHHDRPTRLTYDKISLLPSTHLLAHFLTGCIDFWFYCPFSTIIEEAQGLLPLRPLLSQGPLRV